MFVNSCLLPLFFVVGPHLSSDQKSEIQNSESELWYCTNPTEHQLIASCGSGFQMFLAWLHSHVQGVEFKAKHLIMAA